MRHRRFHESSRKYFADEDIHEVIHMIVQLCFSTFFRFQEGRRGTDLTWTGTRIGTGQPHTFVKFFTPLKTVFLKRSTLQPHVRKNSHPTINRRIWRAPVAPTSAMKQKSGPTAFFPPYPKTKYDMKYVWIIDLDHKAGPRVGLVATWCLDCEGLELGRGRMVRGATGGCAKGR